MQNLKNVLVAALAFGTFSLAADLGAAPPSLIDLVNVITGQPNVECEDVGEPPGHSSTAPGSAFNEDGKAGTVYAGEQPQNSKNRRTPGPFEHCPGIRLQRGRQGGNGVRGRAAAEFEEPRQRFAVRRRLRTALGRDLP
jgi:hypothetical protein